MFMKRPHTNTEAERSAKFDIQELIAFERFCRDNGQWEEMKKCYLDDSFVDISWFKGTGDEFVTASQKIRGYSPHKIHNILTYVNEDRAVSIMIVTLQVRLPVNGVICEVNSDTKLLFKTQKKDGQWYIKGFTFIYDKDSMMPVIPSNEVTFPASALDGLRESYACLAYTGISSGRSINNELPGRDRPDLVEEIYKELENWLYEKER